MTNTLGMCFCCRCVGMTQQHLLVAPCSEFLSQLSSRPSKFLHHIGVLLFHFGHSLWFMWVWQLSCFLSHLTEWQIIVIRRFVSQTSTSDQDKSDATSSPFLRVPPGQVSVFVGLISGLDFKFVLSYSWSVFSSGLSAAVCVFQNWYVGSLISLLFLTSLSCRDHTDLSFRRCVVKVCSPCGAPGQAKSVQSERILQVLFTVGTRLTNWGFPCAGIHISFINYIYMTGIV